MSSSSGRSRTPSSPRTAAIANEEDIHVQIDADSGKIRVFRARTAAVRDRGPADGIHPRRRAGRKADAHPGELVETEQLDGDVFGRIGAQTAKQVVLQRLREAERDVVFDQFASREGELITGRSIGSSPGRSSSTWARASRACSRRPSSRRSSTTASART